MLGHRCPPASTRSSTSDLREAAPPPRPPRLPETLQPVVPGVPLSAQILAFATARGRRDAVGNPDFSGLAITQGPCTYVIAQSALLGWTSERVQARRRTWKPFRAGSTLHLDHIGRRAWETRRFQRPETVIHVECYVFGGVARRRFGGAPRDRDAVADFLATLDAGVDQLGSIERISMEPADHFGWIDAAEEQPR